MRRARLRCFWLYSFVVIFLTTIPYMLGFASQEQSSIFTGFVFGVEDGNSYIAKMLLGVSGDWLFRTPYTTQPQRGVLAFLPYILLGKLAAGEALHLQLVTLYHLFRVAAIPLAIWATYRFIEHFISNEDWSAWATVLATIGSGLGWLPVLLDRSTFLGSLPLGFISPETFGFLSYFGLPHLLLARALLLFALRWYLESPQDSKKGWQAGIALASLGFVQPLTMLPAYTVVGAHQLLILVRGRTNRFAEWRESWMEPLLKLFGVSLPIFFYFVLVFSTDPFLSKWTDQNRILSPHPVHYLIAYAVLLPWIIGGIIKVWSTRDEKWQLPLAWAVLIPFLAYAPYNLQRRLPEGSWVALVLLAVLGLREWRMDRLKRSVRMMVLLLSLITPLFLVYGGIQVGISRRFPAFRDDQEITAFKWLADNAPEDAVVLGSFASGNALPAWAPLRVVIGHGPESVNLYELKPLVEAFFTNQMTENEDLDFLIEQRVDYVFFGPTELAIGRIDSQSLAGMELVYGSGNYYIYQFVGVE